MSGRTARRIECCVIVGQLLVIAALVCAVLWPQHPPICQHEYSTTCLWIGPIQGNGHGRIVWNGPAADRP